MDSPVDYLDSDGLEAVSYLLHHPSPPPDQLTPETKAYLCKYINLYKGDVKRVWKQSDDDRKRDLSHGSWYESTTREAENWSLAAGWDDITTTPVAITVYALHKVIPGTKTTPFSMNAWTAGLYGRDFQHKTPDQLMRWCNDCGSH
jgi:hypothetical protein